MDEAEAKIALIFAAKFYNANKIFHVTVLLVICFCNQFVAPKIRRSRRHCSVCQRSTWYSVTRTRF